MLTQREFDEMQLEAKAIVDDQLQAYMKDFLAHRAGRPSQGRIPPPMPDASGGAASGSGAPSPAPGPSYNAPGGY